MPEPRTPVSSRVAARIARDYPEDDRGGVGDALASLDLGPWKIGRSEEGRERIHAAILILAHGDHVRLRRAMDLAAKDWRDVLMAAELADGSWPERVNAYLALTDATRARPVSARYDHGSSYSTRIRSRQGFLVRAGRMSARLSTTLGNVPA